MAKKKHRAVHRYQKILEALNGGKAAVLYTSYVEPCPKRGGPDHPHEDHPGMVGFGTCRGCRYNMGLFGFGMVCKHAKAREVAAKTLAEAREWEESQQQGRLL